jgi:hypothetical protein
MLDPIPLLGSLFYELPSNTTPDHSQRCGSCGCVALPTTAWAIFVNDLRRILPLKQERKLY